MIHQTAHVHPEAQIDETAEVGPFCVIGPHVRIGKKTRLRSHVVVEGWTEIGEENDIYQFASLGAIPQDLKYKGEPTRLIVGNRNVIRESVTLNLGTVQGGGKTQVGDENLLMAYVHLRHDCIVGSHTVLANSAGFAGHCIVEDYAIVGGMVGVQQAIHIGKHSYIAAKTGIDRDCPPFAIVGRAMPPYLRGANIVGMRRRGFPAETITQLNEALKLWGRSEVNKDQCLLEIESQFGEVAEVQELVTFIRESRSGVIK